jgi:hypothetical protein
VVSGDGNALTPQCKFFPHAAKGRFLLNEEAGRRECFPERDCDNGERYLGPLPVDNVLGQDEYTRASSGSFCTK